MFSNENMQLVFENEAEINARTNTYQSCVDNALGNYVKEGRTYAQVVFSQTMAWCAIEYQ